MLPEGRRETFKLLQYRILAYILFRPLPYVRVLKGERHVKIEKMSSFVADIGYRSNRIRMGLVELEKLGIIHDLKFSYNKAAFYVEKTQI